MNLEKGGYMIKNKDGKYVATPKLKKVMMDTAQISGGVKAVSNSALRTASALKVLSKKEMPFYTGVKDASKRMKDKISWDKLMSARAKLLR